MGGPTGSSSFIDVRDLAHAYVLALERREAGNERFMLSAGVFANAEMAAFNPHMPKTEYTAAVDVIDLEQGAEGVSASPRATRTSLCRRPLRCSCPSCDDKRPCRTAHLGCILLNTGYCSVAYAYSDGLHPRPGPLCCAACGVHLSSGGSESSTSRSMRRISGKDGRFSGSYI